MSLRREVGGLVLWGGFLYLVIQGCIVLRPARTIAVASALLASLLQTCGVGGLDRSLATTTTPTALWAQPPSGEANAILGPAGSQCDRGKLIGAAERARQSGVVGLIHSPRGSVAIIPEVVITCMASEKP